MWFFETLLRLPELHIEAGVKTLFQSFTFVRVLRPRKVKHDTTIQYKRYILMIVLHQYLWHCPYNRVIAR